MAQATIRIVTAGEEDLAALIARTERLAGIGRRRSRAAFDEEQRHYREGARRTSTEVQAADQSVRRARLRELALTDAARARSESLYLRMIGRATEVLARETGKRENLTEREFRRVQDLARAMVVEHTRAEAAKTAATRQESQRREQLQRGVASRVSAGARAVGSAAIGVGRDLYSASQDSRERRAQSGRSLNSAFFQAGVGSQEGAMMRAYLQRELTQGGLRGLRMEDVAGAIGGAQTQFSVLSGRDAGARMANLQRQVELMSFARDTYQDPREVLRVAGMLGQQGIRGADQRSMLMSLTGMAGAGAIELSTLTSAALGPLMQNVSTSVNGNMSPQQRSAAVQRAVAETMAVGELGAAAGLTPRDALNALAKTRTSVTSATTQERLYERLRSTGRGDLAERLFRREGDRNVLRDPNAVGLMSSLVRGYGGDTNAVTNVLSAGGPGSPMVLDSQQRRLIRALASQTGEGESVQQRVERMMGEGTRFTDRDVQRGAAMVAGEELTAQNIAGETRDNALTDNTSALVRLSNAIADFARANPIAGSLGGAAAGAAGGLAGAALARGAGSVAGRAAAALGIGGGAAAGGGTLAAGAIVGAKLVGALGAGMLVGEGINRLAYNDRERAQGDTSILSAETWRNFATAVGQVFTDGLRSNPVTVTLDPTATVHATTVASRSTTRAP